MEKKQSPMTPATQTSATPTPGTAFDRTICFTFFQPWLEAIRRYYMEHPGITQQATADALHCSVGKVNKVVRGIRSGDGIHSGSGIHSACDIHIHNDSTNENASNKVIQGSATFPDSPPPDDGPAAPAVFFHGEGAAE